MPPWKSKSVQKRQKKLKKNKRWSKVKKSRSRSKSRSKSRRESIKAQYTKKRSNNRKEFSKFLKSKSRKNAWKPKFKKSPKNVKKDWKNDLDFDAMIEVSPGELKNHMERQGKREFAVPNWPPVAPSPSNLPNPTKIFNSKVSPIKLLRPMDLKGVKSKRDHTLLTPAQILLMKPVAEGPKKKRAKTKKKTRKKSRKKSRNKKGGFCLTKS